MRKVRQEEVSAQQLQCEPKLWGEGAEERVRAWLSEHYDRNTMPPLIVTEDYFLLGWDHKNTKWPPLLPLIFGEAYAAKRRTITRDWISLRKTIDKHGTGEYGATTDRKAGT